MKRCIGFGFDTSDISAQALLDFDRKYLPEDYDDYIEHTFGQLVEYDDMTEEERKKAVSGIKDWIISEFSDLAEFFLETINHLEGESILSVPSGVYGYVVKEPSVFPDVNSKIKNKDDFIVMIARYLDVKCGTLYEGEEFDRYATNLEMNY